MTEEAKQRRLCPVCDGLPLQPTRERGVAHLRCDGCEGVFIASGSLAAYVEAVSDSHDAAEAYWKLLGTGIREDTPGISHRACPICQGPLERFAYGSYPLVAADRCDTDDGLWLDDGDLEKVVRAARATATLEYTAPKENDQSFDKDEDPHPLACPNCAQRFPGASAGDRCDACKVVLIRL